MSNVWVAQTAAFAVCGFSYQYGIETGDLKNAGPRYPLIADG
jgi:hypothetical protein